jgi:hypothetical protein
MSRYTRIKLDCGIEADYWTYNGWENLHISLIDLYNGFDSPMYLFTLVDLLSELAEKGYRNSGLSREVGYYDSTDDLIWHVTRKIKK